MGLQRVRRDWATELNWTWCLRGFPADASGKEPLSANAGDLRYGVWSLVQEDPLEEEMATRSSYLAWRIPWTEEPGRLQSKSYKETWLSKAWTHVIGIVETKLNKEENPKEANKIQWQLARYSVCQSPKYQQEQLRWWCKGMMYTNTKSMVWNFPCYKHTDSRECLQ